MNSHFADFLDNEVDRIYGLSDSELIEEAKDAYKKRESFVHQHSWIGYEYPSYWDLLEHELHDRKMTDVLYNIDPELLEE